MNTGRVRDVLIDWEEGPVTPAKAVILGERGVQLGDDEREKGEGWALADVYLRALKARARAWIEGWPEINVGDVVDLEVYAAEFDDVGMRIRCRIVEE